jgi:hypothetical protein
MRTILIYVPGVVLTFGFLRWRLSITKEVTHNDKREFEFTPPVEHQHREIDMHKVPSGQRKATNTVMK